jgi:hypothetical protein
LPYLLGAALLSTPVANSRAQASLAGRVLTDSGRLPIADAELRLARLNAVAVTDSGGRFAFKALPGGHHVVVTRALGFRPDTSVVELDAQESLSRDFILQRSVARLSEVRVRDSLMAPRSAKLIGFDDRRNRTPGGHFFDAALIEKWGSRHTGDLISTVAGVDLKRSGSSAFAVGSRAPPSLSVGPRPDPCLMDVYVDGALVFSKALPNSPFDLNTVRLSSIAAIEVYTGPSNVPPEFNRTSKGCGVIVIWTR